MIKIAHQINSIIDLKRINNNYGVENKSNYVRSSECEIIRFNTNSSKSGGGSEEHQEEGGESHSSG